jgi:hypothetical protein
MIFSKPWIGFPQDPQTKVPILDLWFPLLTGH